MKHNLFIFLTAFIFIFSSCEKDDEVLITKIEVKNVKIVPAYYSADISWKVSSDATISEVFVQYATDASFSKYQEIQMTSGGSNQYQTTITGLTDNTLYYIRCKAQNKINSHIGYSNNFTTKKKTTPTIDKVTANASYTSISCTANISDDGGQQITNRGVYYATTANPTTANHSITCGSGGGSYTCTIPNLTPETTYYIRAYAIYNGQTIYGSQNAYTTLALTTPTVTTASSATNITESSATISNNKVTDDGGLTVAERGICYATTTIPTTSNSKVTSGCGTGSFTCSLTGLKKGTKYYVRAYATNSKGTSYGKEINFTTNTEKPTVTTLSATNITATTVICGGDVTSDGGSAVTERGVCYATTTNPTTSNSKLTSESGTGSFTCSLTGLIAGTTYYVRAYAKNSVGTSYGEQKSFTTKTDKPTVTTSYGYPKNITTTSATCGGNVTSDGGLTVTERGICYSTVSNPTIEDNKMSNGSGTGRFECSLEGLTPGTTYYACAYAKNSKGTSYSNQMAFTTQSSITYKASSKLTEVTGYYEQGLRKYAFDASIISHTFSNGTGTILFNSGVTKIEDCAFYLCETMTSVTLPNSVITIRDDAFSSCTGLTSITIPSNVTSLGRWTFSNCTGLISITCKATSPPTIDATTFNGIKKSIPVYVPSGSVYDYKQATGWSDFTNIRSY